MIGYVLSHDRNQDKLSPRAHKCVFVGYSNTQKGYRLYHPTTKGVFVSKDVTFDENTFFYSRQPSHNDPGFLDATPDKEDNMIPVILETPDIIGSEQVGYSTDTPRTDQNLTAESANDIVEPEGSEHQFQYYPKFYERKKKESKESTKDVSKGIDAPEKESSTTNKAVEDPTSRKQTINADITDNVEDKTDEWPIALRKGTRSCVKPLPYNMVNYLDYQQVSPGYKCFLTTIQDIETPRNLEEALKNPDWKQAMDDEMTALVGNQTWELVNLPSGKKPVGCRWVYTIKCNSDGSLERYKARLVAKGYTQKYGIDYQETFAPVAKMNTIRVLISLAVNLDWELLQYDIKNAFLYGELKEEIYMQVPPGYNSESTRGKVCRLKKAIYGLK